MKFVFFFSLFQSYNPEHKRQKLFVLTPVQQKKKQNKTKQSMLLLRFLSRVHKQCLNFTWSLTSASYQLVVNWCLSIFITNQSLHWPNQLQLIPIPNRSDAKMHNSPRWSQIDVCVCSFRMKFGIENCARNLPQINIFSRFTTRTQ